MADRTKIQWSDATWNPITGCSVVSPGCTNCYAMRLAGTRLRHHPSRTHLTESSKAGPVWNGVVKFNEQWLDQPLRWRRPRRIFCVAHGDLFHENVPDEWIDKVFAVMALAPQHTFQVLTKRADRMREYLNQTTAPGRIFGQLCHVSGNRVVTKLAVDRLGAPLPNVWLGVSVEDQKRADERIPHLLATPAAVRWVSAEPLLSDIDFSPWIGYDPVHDNMQAERRIRLPSGAERRSRDSARRDDLEDPEARLGSMEKDGSESPLQAGKGRTRCGGLSTGSDNDRRGSGLRSGRSAGLSTSARPDSEGQDSEPRGREEKEQLAGQSYADDQFGTANPRDPHSQSRASGRSVRDEKSRRKADSQASRRNQTPPGDGRKTDPDCERLRDNVPNGVEDRTRQQTISWIVCGGESGPGARPMHPDWARSTRDQCNAAGVAFLFKQWGAWAESNFRDPTPPNRHVWPDGKLMVRVGKRAAGRLLDGRGWNEYPEVT